jgi:hypothetical protein
VGRKPDEVGGAVPAKFIEYLVAALEDEDDDLIIFINNFPMSRSGEVFNFNVFFRGGGS